MSAMGLSSVWGEGMSSLASRLMECGGGELFIEAGSALARDVFEQGFMSEEAEHLAGVMLHQLEHDPCLENVASSDRVLLAATAAVLAVARPEQTDLCDRVARIWLQEGASIEACGPRPESLVAWTLLAWLVQEADEPTEALDALRKLNRHELVRSLEIYRQAIHQGTHIDPDGMYDLPKQSLFRLLAARLLAAHDGFGPEALCSWLHMNGFA